MVGRVDFEPWFKTDRPSWEFVHVLVLTYPAPRPIG